MTEPSAPASPPGPVIHVLFVFGTRPEAIKLAPLARHLASHPDEFRVSLCVTAQHRSLLDRVLQTFQLEPHFDLDLMRPDQSLAALTARVIERLDPVLHSQRPDIVLVQGDTTTAMAAALASFYRHIAVGHVEAGLRTGNYDHPFPEEMNRVLTTRLSTLHFAPTARSVETLRAEGVPNSAIFLTGNTGIDALLYTRDRLEHDELAAELPCTLHSEKRLILMTAHRRESFGAPMESICRAVRRIASRGDVQVVYPVHPNPNVRRVVEPALGGVSGVDLVEPQDYVPFVELLRRCSLILTDSGGIQEEAPSLGKPVLVLRETTERPEALEAGTARLVGTDEDRIVQAVEEILDGSVTAPPCGNPFGDGQASPRIASAILSFFRA